MLLKPGFVWLNQALTRLRRHARFWRQRDDRRQAAELQGMSARELNDLGIGRGEIPYLLLSRGPDCEEGKRG